MVAKIDDFKSLISQKGGLAKSNIFRVELPGFPGVTKEEINLLCRDVILPGRQIISREKTIGMQNRSVAYGHLYQPVSMTFVLLNDYGIKKYFEYWQSRAINQTSFEVGYKKDYAKPVKIQQLKKSTNPTENDIIHEVELYDAYPVTINDIRFSNDLDQIAEINVSLQFTNWKSDFEKTIPAPAKRRDAILDINLEGTINSIFDKLDIPNTPQEIFDFVVDRIL